MAGDEEKCRSAGCSGYVTKPVDCDLLVHTIARTLGIESGGPKRVVAEAAADRGPESQAVASGNWKAWAASSRVASTAQPLFSTLPTENPDYREIVEGFLPRLREQLAAMREAMECRNLPELARLAHWLKGTAGTVGFPAFTQPAKRLLTMAQNDQQDGIETVVAEILELGQRVAIPAERSTSPQG
jgi:HPt (histidine-containing phosphotransfer) domain-containing protein